MNIETKLCYKVMARSDLPYASQIWRIRGNNVAEAAEIPFLTCAEELYSYCEVKEILEQK
jgi:hypothetical protein